MKFVLFRLCRWMMALQIVLIFACMGLFAWRAVVIARSDLAAGSLAWAILWRALVLFAAFVFFGIGISVNNITAKTVLHSAGDPRDMYAGLALWNFLTLNLPVAFLLLGMRKHYPDC